MATSAPSRILYERYHSRIVAFVRGMVKDQQRAEDIAQEVFISALRRMRETERPINFKPWLFEIARNASIDAYRRKRRTAEVSYDAEGGLAPADRIRLVASEPGPVEAIGAKQDLEHLTGAFGGLSDTHHEILVLRELEGRSYADIGERLGMSRGAVESTLFRARKRLGEEYEELASGRRCDRVQAVITEGEVPHLGARDQRKLARHLAHCQSCRRLAALTGVEIPAALPKRAADKLRSLLPIPAWLARGGGDGAAVVQLYAGSGEPLVNAWSRAIAALVALAVAGAGVGVQPPGRTPKDAAHASADPEHAFRHGSGGAAGHGAGSGSALLRSGGMQGRTVQGKQGSGSRAGRDEPLGGGSGGGGGGAPAGTPAAGPLASGGPAGGAAAAPSPLLAPAAAWRSPALPTAACRRRSPTPAAARVPAPAAPSGRWSRRPPTARPPRGRWCRTSLRARARPSPRR